MRHTTSVKSENVELPSSSSQYKPTKLSLKRKLTQSARYMSNDQGVMSSTTQQKIQPLGEKTNTGKTQIKSL
jgi:biopolymer transport protein ExbD